MDQCTFLLETSFDIEVQKEHKILSEKELDINKDLKAYLEEAGKADTLFKTFKEISYLKRPNHLIEKPIIAVLILLDKAPQVKPNIDYMNKEDIDQIWFKARDRLKD